MKAMTKFYIATCTAILLAFTGCEAEVSAPEPEKKEELITAENAADAILALEESGTIKVTGEISSATISEITSTLKDLYKKDSHIMVDVDLSGTTGLTKLPDFAFSGCSNLKDIVIPEGVATIAGSEFAGCSHARVYIPSTVTTIFVIRGFCDVAEIIVSPDNPAYSSVDGVLLSHDGKRLMCYPRGKTGQIKIPSCVEILGSNAFYDINFYSNYSIPEGIKTVESGAFNYCHLGNIILPSTLMSFSKWSFTYENGILVPLPENVSVAEGNTTYKSSDGILFNYEGTEIVYYPWNKRDDYTIPDGITKICPFISVNTLTIPGSLKNIEYSSHCFFGPIEDRSIFHKVILSKDVTELPAGLSQCYTGYFEVESGNQNFSASEGVLYNLDGTEIILSPNLPSDLPSYF